MLGFPLLASLLTSPLFGAAVTAAKLLHLSEEQMLSAVGIAGSMAAGSLEFLAEGTWTKRLHPGLAAQNGILAANLAAQTASAALPLPARPGADQQTSFTLSPANGLVLAPGAAATVAATLSNNGPGPLHFNSR